MTDKWDSSMKNALINIAEFARRKRAYVMVLSCVVVFITTYILILPAITLDQEEAAQQGGIDVTTQTEQVQSDATEAEPTDATEAVVTDTSNDTDNQIVEDKEDVQTDAVEAEDSDTVKKTQFGSISFSGKGYEISANCNGANLPDGTEIVAEEINQKDQGYDALYEDALKAVRKNSKNKVYDFDFAKFYDISLISDGEVIEPEKPLDVTISYDKTLRASDADNVRIVHFAENKKTGEVEAKVLDSKHVDAAIKNDNLKETTFQANSFSVYAVVYTAEYEYQSVDGKTYKFTVRYDAESGIPEDAQLKVSELKEGSDEYQKYLEDSAKELGVKETSDISFARFFDIAFVKDGEIIEPTTPVKVKIEYDDALKVSADQSLNVVHFARKGTEVIKDVNLSGNSKELTWQQGSFSVTGTIISGEPSANDKYMVLVNYPTNSNDYYIVNNDGSLTKVVYHNGTVMVEKPMMWTVEGSNPNRHIYFNAEATGFNFQDTAADYYRWYIDPSSESGIAKEDSSNVTVTNGGDGIKSGGRIADHGRDNMLTQTALNTYNDRIYKEPWRDHNHLGVELDKNGVPIHLAGQKADNQNVKIVFAKANNVPTNIGAATHTVDHIDISISGKSKVSVPLAYGTYYYKDAQGNWQTYTVSDDTTLELEKNNIKIEPDDMKKATIKAYDKNGNELDDAFVIDSYSSNASNSLSTVQVRIGGRFKVANLNNDVPQGQDVNSNYWKNQRINNKITYSVSAMKDVTFPIEDDDHGQLYELKSDGTFEPLSITVAVNMGASFDYWDEGNECPAIHEELLGLPSYWYPMNATWRNGGIPELWGQYLSGMDFVLGGDADDASNKIVAIEITKMIVDENGELIKPEEKLVNTFDVYRNGSMTNQQKLDSVQDLDVYHYDTPANYSGYSKLHSKDVIVGTDGMGLVFDYAVTDGMYYITEHHDDESLPNEIVDQDGQVWTYDSTEMHTEYVRRGDGHYDDKTQHPKPLHYSKTYTKEDALSNGTGSPEYASIPDLLGMFTRYDGVQKKEGFLEFYVYNVYKPVVSEVSTTKMWQDAEGNDDGWRANVTFKIMKKTGEGENAVYSNVTAPSYYVQRNMDWSQTITTTSQSKTAKWENLDPLNKGESYVIIESDIVPVKSTDKITDIVRDPKSGAIKSYKLNGAKYVVSGRETSEENATTINMAQPETDIEVEKKWVVPERMSPGNSTMVLYQIVGDKDNPNDPAKPSKKIKITVEADPAPVTTNAGHITVNYTGKDKDGADDSGSFVLSNTEGWSKTLEFDRGSSYEFTYEPDGNKILTVEPDKTGTIADTTTIKLATTAAEIQQYTYTFTVPQSVRQDKGSITVTCNGETKTAKSSNDWTVAFDVAEETPVNYSVAGDGKFISSASADNTFQGKPATGNHTVSVVPVYAPQTMDVPVSVDWNGETPADGTQVTVRFVPDKSGVQTQTATLDKTGWTTTKTLPRLDENGDLIIWTVSHELSPNDGNASVSMALPANGRISDSGNVVLNGTVMSGMNLTVEVAGGTQANIAEFFSLDANRTIESYHVINNTGWINGYNAPVAHTFNNLDVKDSNGNPIYYCFYMYSKHNVSTNAAEAGIGNRYNEYVYVKAEPGNVMIRLSQSSDGNWHVTTGGGAKNSKARAKAMAPKKAASAPSTSQKFYDGAVGGTGDAPFKVISAKDLPEGAVPVPDSVRTDGLRVISGDGTYKWEHLPKYDADGNPIYYYVVEKDATAVADDISVKYAYTYKDDGSIQKVKVINEIEGTPEPITGSVTITKTFEGLSVADIPDDFQITNDYNDQVFTLDGANGTIAATGSGLGPYVWTIHDVPQDTVVKFTESGIQVGGYDLTVNQTKTTQDSAEISAPAIVAGSIVSARLVNKYEKKETQIKITKVGKDNVNNNSTDVLTGAKFKLEKYTSADFVQKDSSWTEQSIEDTNKTGTFNFSGLTTGYYKIVEEKTPAGYVKLESDPTFEVRVNAQTGDLEVVFTNSDLVKYTAANGFRYGNEPGPSLPNSGGPGTMWIYLIGSILLIGCSITLIARRRTRA